MEESVFNSVAVVSHPGGDAGLDVFESDGEGKSGLRRGFGGCSGGCRSGSGTGTGGGGHVRGSRHGE